MKNKIILLASCFITLAYLGAVAQIVPSKATSDNWAILQQADSLKRNFKSQGFVLVKEAAMVMESAYESPVIVPLREGTWYRVVFIGDISSKLYEVRMFDWNEKQVIYQKKMWGDIDGNIINYDYIPRFSEYHLIKPIQVNKKMKIVNGYMLLFKKLI
jgi:hypothetical protein